MWWHKVTQKHYVKRTIPLRNSTYEWLSDFTRNRVWISAVWNIIWLMRINDVLDKHTHTYIVCRNIVNLLIEWLARTIYNAKWGRQRRYCTLQKPAIKENDTKRLYDRSYTWNYLNNRGQNERYIRHKR